jgi:two-component system, OmpR family, phosphate regulon sensor histidine kinase PhoR
MWVGCACAGKGVECAPGRADLYHGSVSMFSNPMIAEGYVIDRPPVKDYAGREGSHSEILRRLAFSIGRSTGACRSATQALLNGADRDPDLRVELLTGIEDELQSIELVLENLVQWRAFELNTFRLQPRLIDVRQWLPNILSRWREAAEQKGLGWHVDAASYLPPLTADADRLAQVVHNLLANAIDYTPPGNEVTVEAGMQSREVFLRVSNTGVVLDEQELALVFQPFFSARAHGRFPQGIGLGLSVAQRLVEVHGGRITAESEPGHGCIFTVWMPVQVLPV